MTSRELMKAAMRRETTGRIPTMPQICHDVALRICATESNTDWMDGYKECAEIPQRIYDYVIDLVVNFRTFGNGLSCWS